MDGLLIYANIFSSWVENLSVFWRFLSSSPVSLIDSALNSLAGNPEAYAAQGLFNLLKVIFVLTGFSDASVLTFIFSIMGTVFGLYFAIQIVKWLLDVFF